MKSKDEVLRALYCCTVEQEDCDQCPYRSIGMCTRDLLRDAYTYIQSAALSMNARKIDNHMFIPVVHSYWIEEDVPVYLGKIKRLKCAACEGPAETRTRYCPHCAAIMDLPEGGE